MCGSPYCSPFCEPLLPVFQFKCLSSGKKMAPNGMKDFFNNLGRKIFHWSPRNEVECLTRKRRSNCVLKSISSKSSETEESDSSRPACSLGTINFEFRGNVLNFQKVDFRQKSCELCCPACCARCCKKCYRKCDSMASLDSACDVTSSSSCEDLTCRFRKPTLEDFIHIHSTNFNCESEPPYENINTTEPTYDAVTRNPHPVEGHYDVLVSKPGVEPKYENLMTFHCIDECVFLKIRALVASKKTLPELIEALKNLHDNYSCVQKPPMRSLTPAADNEINYYYENYDYLENDLNHDIERCISD